MKTLSLAVLMASHSLGLPAAALAEPLTTEQLKEMKPTGLIEHLKSNCCSRITIAATMDFSAEGSPQWITEADVKMLEKLLSDETPAAAAVAEQADDSCGGASTVAREARFLIQAYHEKRFPPSPCSSRMSAMKGWELYSWRESGAWFFSVLPGTNRAKLWEEIQAAGVRGTNAIKHRLTALFPGEDVVWNAGLNVEKPANVRAKLTLPPEQIRRDILDYAVGAGVRMLPE